jgi:hypothetical protein
MKRLPGIDHQPSLGIRQFGRERGGTGPIDAGTPRGRPALENPVKHAQHGPAACTAGNGARARGMPGLRSDLYRIGRAVRVLSLVRKTKNSPYPGLFVSFHTDRRIPRGADSSTPVASDPMGQQAFSPPIPAAHLADHAGGGKRGKGEGSAAASGPVLGSVWPGWRWKSPGALGIQPSGCACPGGLARPDSRHRLLVPRSPGNLETP